MIAQEVFFTMGPECQPNAYQREAIEEIHRSGSNRVWLHGGRRIGKTTLARVLSMYYPNPVYFGRNLSNTKSFVLRIPERYRVQEGRFCKAYCDCTIIFDSALTNPEINSMEFYRFFHWFNSMSINNKVIIT